MKVLQINSIVNSGSTGRIAEDIGKVLMQHGHESYIAYGRESGRPSQSHKIKIGSFWNSYLHFIKSALLDRHGFGSKRATLKLLKMIDQIQPDVVALHNLHGYYIHIGILFDYLKRRNIPVVWTLFDCWAFTGHCSYFDNIQCEKWKRECHHCPKKKFYPSSYLLDNSKQNFHSKQNIFTNHNKLEIIVHSDWLASFVNKSFLNQYPIHKIASGVDIYQFCPQNSSLKNKLNIAEKHVILGCASVWDRRKGFDDFLELETLLSDDYVIILVGVSSNMQKLCHGKFICIERTESVDELAEYYSIADVFVNPTYQDNFPTTNLEALACGTPVVTYNTGGSPEAVDDNTGIVVSKGNVVELKLQIEFVIDNKAKYSVTNCRTRALSLYNKDDRFLEYLNVFDSLLGK